MRRLSFAILLAAASLLAAAPVVADIGPPVTIRLLGELSAAEAGREYHGEIEVVAGVTAECAGFRLEGDGWTATAVEAPASMTLSKDARFVVPFAAVPKDPDRPLEFVFELGGQTVRKSLDLSRARYERLVAPVAARPAPFVPPDLGEAPAEPADAVPPGRVQPLGQPHDPEDAADPAKRYSINVHGTWSYQRSDGPWIGAYGILVSVYDQDAGDADDLLAQTWTSSTGAYSTTFDWSQAEGGPEIYVTFETVGYHIELRDATSGHYTYRWTTGVTPSYAGTSLDLGNLTSGDEALMPALHVFTDIKRTWAWLNYSAGYNQPDVDVYWPDGTSGAWWWANIVHISSGSQWSEATHTHEYGHHWMGNFGIIPAFDYCNGVCDASATDCGHCLWCWESGAIAWLEGFPDWLGDLIPDTYASVYGLAASHAYNFESLATCGGSYNNAYLTEGFMAAMLLDLQDSNLDSHGVYGSWHDAATLGWDEIFTVADVDQPLSAQEFINDFKARYPVLKEALWETGKNCGYDEDVAAPAVVTGLTSPSHTVSVSSPDPTITFTWTRASDDFSGVAGYGIFISSGHGTPSAEQDIGDVTTYTTPSLAPGTYYFSIRTVDRAGRWGASYAWSGPYIIRAAEPANLAYHLFSGWDHVLVPRSTNDASGSSATVPATLPGNANSTYWNVGGENNGESWTSTRFATRRYVDGSYTAYWTWGAIGAGGLFIGTNGGPFTVHGGRHTFSARLDALDAIAETNEADNPWGHQWVWTPYTLTANTAVVRSPPPDRDGGWDMVTDGSLLWYDCDGLRFSSSGWWNAVVLRHTNLANDYDLRLHGASTSSVSGFATNFGYSTRAAGLTDAVLVNRNTQGILDYDVGVLNVNDGANSYEATHVTSNYHAFGDSITYTYAVNQMLRLWEFYVSAENVGPVSITVDIDPANGPVYALWLDETFATGDLGDYAAFAATDASGRARLDINVASDGYNGLVVYRDPTDGTAAIPVTIEIQKTPPDFLNYAASGWHSPLVPRPAADGTPASVALPDTLHGNQASTYLNMAVRNESPTGSPSLGARGFLDGADTWGVAWGSFPGYASSLFNWGQVFSFRGGRHTLAFRLDWQQEIEEIHEDNNVFGEQYMWSPLLLALNTPVTRGAPPNRSGGWEDIRSGEGIWYNCDGLRMPNSGGWWRAVAVMPAATADVDLRLHPLLDGAKSGFGSSLAYSGWGTGQSDYVLVNFNVTGYQPYDAGVLQWAGASLSYTAEATASSGYISNPAGLYGPYSLAAGRILGLHEFYLPAGVTSIRLDNVTGSADLGLTLHPAGSAYYSKSSAVSGGSAWLNGSGLGEWFTVDLATAGWYCVAVWKAFSADLPVACTYRLHFGAGVTDVPPDGSLPVATRLVSVQPNPFNPRTHVALETAAAQRVRLAVHDLHGRLVRVLVDAELPRGRHDILWDGLDGEGRPAPSGVYMTRLEAGETRQMLKMILVR